MRNYIYLFLFAIIIILEDRINKTITIDIRHNRFDLNNMNFFDNQINPRDFIQKSTFNYDLNNQKIKCDIIKNSNGKNIIPPPKIYLLIAAGIAKP